MAMKKRSLALALLLTAIQLAAQNAPVHVLASNGVKAVIEDLRKQAEETLKRPLMIEYDTSTVVKKRIDDGAAFDVAILTSDVIDDLAKAAKIDPGTRMEIARCGIGVGVRAGAAKPDIKTSDALKKTLVASKSITYTKTAPAASTFFRCSTSLGLPTS